MRTATGIVARYAESDGSVFVIRNGNKHALKAIAVGSA
jgi:hypothetical protein